MTKRLVLCTAEFGTEEEAENFGEKLGRRHLDYVVSQNILTVEYRGDDWEKIVALFENLPKRSIIVNTESGCESDFKP